MLWNATSINGKEDEFGYYINNKNIDIALITETWLKSHSKINFSNYDIIRSDSTRNNAGGVAIVVNTKLKFHTLPPINISECEITLIKLQSGINLTVGVIYVPPNAQFVFESLNDIFNNYAPIIIGGDFNAKHRSWNNIANNSRGIKLYNYLRHYDITLIHSSTYTHKLPRRNPSNIDIFLTKDLSYNSTCSTDNDLSSNHLPVILTFDRVNIAKNNLKINKTDWEEFYKKTDRWRIDYRTLNSNSIDHCIETLQKFLQNAYKQSSTF